MLKSQLARLGALEERTTTEQGPTGTLYIQAWDFATDAEEEAFASECHAEMRGRGYDHSVALAIVEPGPRPVRSNPEPWSWFPWDGPHPQWARGN
jgi:hypothetical protein